MVDTTSDAMQSQDFVASDHIRTDQLNSAAEVWMSSMLALIKLR